MSNEIKMKKMALGRRAAYLRRCVTVVNILSKYENESSIRGRIFEKHVKPVVDCSVVTFYNMLNEPNPTNQLLKIEVEIEELKKENVL